MNNYKIYTLIDPNTNLVRYVGQTCRSLNERFRGHYNRCSGGTKKESWVFSLRKQNQKPIIDLVEDGLTKEEANKKEIEYIKLYKAVGAKLTNMSIGGNSIPYGLYKGKIVSEATREKLRIASTGRKHSEETKALIGFYSKMRLPSKEHINKIIECHSKPICQYDLNGNFIKEYKSTRQAERETGITHGSISGVAIGAKHRHTAGGFKWKYKE